MARKRYSIPAALAGFAAVVLLILCEWISIERL